jgi:dTDP-4-dehydrorhamnose reductase
MLRVAGQGKPLRVVNDQRCTPSSTQDVARATLQLLETKQYGLYHLTNSGDCSWYEFAAEIFRLSGLSPSLTAIPTVDYPTPAKRPEYSVLDLSQLTSVGVARPRPWQEALAEYLSKRRTG